MNETLFGNSLCGCNQVTTGPLGWVGGPQSNKTQKQRHPATMPRDHHGRERRGAAASQGLRRTDGRRRAGQTRGRTPVPTPERAQPHRLLQGRLRAPSVSGPWYLVRAAPGKLAHPLFSPGEASHPPLCCFCSLLPPPLPSLNTGLLRHLACAQAFGLSSHPPPLCGLLPASCVSASSPKGVGSSVGTKPTDHTPLTPSQTPRMKEAPWRHSEKQTHWWSLGRELCWCCCFRNILHSVY